MKNFIQSGHTLTFIATAVLASGAGVLLGDQGLFGVNLYKVAIGDEGEAKVDGVVDLPKAAVAIDRFDRAYWDDTNKVVTNVATDNTIIGYFTTDAAGGDATVNVMLTPVAVADAPAP